MNKPRTIARPLFVLAFVASVACFATVHSSNFTAQTPSSSYTNPPWKALCVAKDDHTSIPVSTAQDAGNGYAKISKGTNFTSVSALYQACGNADFDPLIRTFCTNNPGDSYQTITAVYDKDNRLQSPPIAWNSNYILCPAAASSSSASVFKGVCVVRDNQANTPAYTAADAGKGYAKKGMGTNFTSTLGVIQACTNAVFDPLVETFCQGNPGGSYQTLVALYDQNNTLQTPPVYMVQNFRPCPAAASPVSSSSSRSSSLAPTPTATPKGACVVRDFNTDVPSSYNAPDSGHGYAKMKKSMNVISIETVQANCTRADYTALEKVYCAENPDESYEMDVAMYDRNGTVKSTDCGKFGCDLVQCPPPDEPSYDTSDTEDDNADTSVEATGTHTEPVDRQTPPAGYEDEVLTNIEAFKNPFPDTDMHELTGKAAAELYRRAVIGGFPDGEFKSDRPVNRAEAAKFLLLTRDGSVEDVDNSGIFSDVLDGQWYTKFVVTAANEGIIRGYADGTFRPANQVNTAEFLKMLSLTFGLEENMSYTYKDVPSDSWFTPYAGIAQTFNLFPDRSSALQPERPLTRGEVAVAIYQYLTNR